MPRANKESFAKALQSLLRKYELDRDTYISPEYNEAQARSQFISPFFRALGWDVENEAGVPYNLCDVWEEKGETHGRPDYTFRLDAQTKFFIEAKAPCPDVSNVDHILQTKRYAWNSRDVFYAGLFDFEEILFFDASLEPDERRPRDGEAFHLIFNEYLSNIGGWHSLNSLVLFGVAYPLRFCFAKGGAFDFAFFLFVSHPQKPFNRPNSRLTPIFDHSL